METGTRRKASGNGATRRRFVAAGLAALGLAGCDYTDMDFRLAHATGNCAPCDWIVADGLITKDTPIRFQAFIDSLPAASEGDGPREIDLNSLGGNLVASLDLGQMIRSHGLRTRVAGTVHQDDGDLRTAGDCLSACAYMFLGGVARSADTGTLGVHHYFFEKDSTAVQRLLAPLYLDYETGQYVARMGVDPRFEGIVSATPSGDMHYFTDAELTDFRIRWQKSEEVGPSPPSPQANRVSAHKAPSDSRRELAGRPQ